MREPLDREGVGWARGELAELGLLAGSGETQEWGRLAERTPPSLGRLLDEQAGPSRRRMACLAPPLVE